MHTIFSVYSCADVAVCIVLQFDPKLIIVITSRKREKEKTRDKKRASNWSGVYFNRIRFQLIVHDWSVCNNNHGNFNASLNTFFVLQTKKKNQAE